LLVFLFGLSACGGSQSPAPGTTSTLPKPSELPGSTDIKVLTKNAKPGFRGLPTPKK
jgi:hypothetical protein